MKKLVSVTCPENIDFLRNDLTKGKIYPIITELETVFSIKDDTGHEVFFPKSDFILNYEPDTTERSREIVSNLLLREFNSMPDTCDDELIQAAKDFGFDELANEMENQTK